MGNPWALCTTWFPVCFPSLSQQQNCFYSRHPGFHQRVRLAGKKYNGSSPNWPHLLIHNRPWTLFFSPCPECRKDAWGEIQQLWKEPSDLHKISKVPDWHMMKCLVFFHSLSHFHREQLRDDFQGKDVQMMNLGKFAQLIILTGFKKNISVIPWMDSCLKYVQIANKNLHTN